MHIKKHRLLPGRKPARDRLQRGHHVSDGSLREIVGTIRVVTGTDYRRRFYRDVWLVLT